MRIRKNARLGGGLVSTEKLQPLVCQLNRSPWDVSPFASDLIQFQQFRYGEDDGFAGNAYGDVGNSDGVVKSVASPMHLELKSPPNIQKVVAPNNADMSKQNGIVQSVHKVDEENKRMSSGPCKNNKGKKQEQSIYEHNKSSSMRSKNAMALAGTRRTRSSRTSNSGEFYYYSGFGPLWGKQRGGRNNAGLDDTNGLTTKGSGEDLTVTKANATPINQIDTERFDYTNDEDDEDYENMTKRVRKPVKARSLKSLM